MTRRFVVPAAGLALAFAAGVVASTAVFARTQAGRRLFEIRTYTTQPGRLDALHARFRDHTTRLFAKHGMTNIGYWTPQDAPASQNTLIYVLAHRDRESAKRSWDAFRADPDWVKARTASEAAGPIVLEVKSVFVDPTDYSPMK